MDARRLARRLNLLGPWLRRVFGGVVVKIGLDPGFGCPNRDPRTGAGGCIFCPPTAYGHHARPDEPVAEQLARGLERLRARARYFGRPAPLALAYYQAYSSTNASAPRLAQALAPALQAPGVGGLIVSTRPDCLDGPRWDVLEQAAARAPLWLELGLQSAHAPSLAAMGRGHDVACFDAAVAQARQRGLDVVAHVVLGLPGEDLTHTNATAEHLAGLGLWGVKIHNLMVLEGARLARLWRDGRHQCWTLAQNAQALAQFVARLPAATLIHRLAADPRGERLLAPDWARDKNHVLAALADELERLDLHQGDLCPKRP